MSDKQQVMSLVQSGQWEKARVACTRLCQANLNDPEAWFFLAGINATLGAMDEVIACCQKVIALQPANIGAHYNLGVALQTQGRHEEAETAYRQVIVLEPGNVLAHANLGLALRALGKIDEAVESCRKAIELKPDLVEALNTLGLALRDQGQLDNAVESLRQAVKYQPSYAEGYFNLGLCYEKQELYGAAESSYRQALNARPSYPEAHARLGALLVKLNNFDEAIDHYRRVLELKPDDYVEIYNELANLLLDHKDPLDNYPEAERCYRKALALRPDLVEVHLNLAIMLLEMGSLEDAKVHFQRALDIESDCVGALAGMAMVLEHQGNFEEGMALLRPLLITGSLDIHVALAYAALARHFDERLEAVALLERFDDQSMATTERVQLHFALGKLYDELKDYAKAFEHFYRANTMEDVRYNESESKRPFNEMIEVFSKKSMERRARASNCSRLPMFIVGMPRSGTSLVEQILASHPEVYGAGELEDMHRIATTISAAAKTSLPYPYSVDSLNRKQLDKIAEMHLGRLGRYSKTATRVTDKMPHNFMGLGLIDQLFPGARVIHCKRDPVDTCLSIYFQRFNMHHPYACDLAALGFYYRQYERLMEHWKSVLRIPIMEVQYEELVANQEEVSRAMVEFCGLKWNDECLHFYASKRVTKTPSYDQVRRPIYKKSVARWKNYERFLDPLLNELGMKP